MIAPEAAFSILVIEDDVTLNRLLVGQLKRLGYATAGATSLAAADQLLQGPEPDLMLMDLRLPDSSGTEPIVRLSRIAPVIVLTAYGSVDQAVKAVQAGAVDFLTKPVAPGRLEVSVRRALEAARMRRKLAFLETRVRAAPDVPMVGRSTAFARVGSMIAAVAAADTTVLVLGESGAGKDVVARAIHEHSPRRDGEFVTVDCSMLREGTLESELFGHERGAFAGAEHRKEGLLEMADGGTVFLDEIGEIDTAAQARLLRMLESGRYRRLGGLTDQIANVRFVASSNRNLAAWVREGRFREDLYYRLSAFEIPVPPLRDRREDILPLAHHFLVVRPFLRDVDKRFTAEAEKSLLAHDWPGNIRELRNVVERGLLMSGPDRLIRPDHLLLRDTGPPREDGFVLRFGQRPTLDEVREAYMRKIMAENDLPRARLAEIMGVSERSIYRIVKDLN